MKHAFYKSGLVFLLILSIGIFAGCDKDDDNDNDNNSNGIDMSCWPDNLPEFEYGDPFSILCPDGVFGGATFHNVTNPETALNGYKTALNNAGWVFDEDQTTEFVWGVWYEKGANWVQVTIQKEDSGAAGGAQIYYGD